ncbi:cob(I)yrinic acid a,c-diamide adenosyltransferase [Deltaproteobacteria bacterium TL4]
MSEKQSQRKKLIMIHTGDGKGKTTAAVGMAMRTVAHGWKAAMVQFLKSPGDYQYGERKLSEQLEGFEVFTMGAGFTWETQNRELDLQTTGETWEKCKAVTLCGKYRLVIWDEINYVLNLGLLDEKEVIAFLKRPLKVHLVLTGRKAPSALMEIADLVTEMKAVKHPYRQQGIKAQKGIEW